MITLGDLIEVLHENVKSSHHAKINESFHRIWSMVAVVPMYLAMSTTGPLSNLMILSETTASGKWS